MSINTLNICHQLRKVQCAILLIPSSQSSLSTEPVWPS